jgi:hypothetical protein
MMLILLIICHFFTGYGLLKLLRIRCRPLIMMPLAILSGIAVASLIPFLLQLCYCPLYPSTVLGSLGLICVLLNVRHFGGFFRRNFKLPSIRIRIYELPAILILTFLVFVSVWRCYYQPPYSRDVLSGPEAIAEFTVREHTMLNSFFSVDLSTTNNPFKSPFLTSLQVIYKMAGYPFGQLWLSMIFVSFTLLLYQVLKETLHPVLAGLLLLLLTMSQELYAYSFLILYDYSNMVFMFLSLYFLFESNGTRWPADEKRTTDAHKREFYFSALLMGVATYIRAETLVLAVFFLPWMMRKNLSRMGWFLLPSIVSYLLTVTLFVNHYLPVKYDIGMLVNPHPFHLWPLFGIYRDMVTGLMAGRRGIDLWGYFMIVWAALLAAELLILRRLNRVACRWLYAVVVIFLGLGLLSFMLPLMEVEYTIKRGLFKILPPMLLYMANNQLLVRLSQWATRWERQ